MGDLPMREEQAGAVVTEWASRLHVPRSFGEPCGPAMTSMRTDSVGNRVGQVRAECTTRHVVRQPFERVSQIVWEPVAHHSFRVPLIFVVHIG
jgi:hypothetical protein